MSDLKTDLASLRIDREDAPPSRRKGIVAAVVLVVLAGGGYAAWRGQQALAVVEVATTQASLIEAGGAGSAGAPVLTASGYVVARRKAVVSAKIQGRLAYLAVEEGSRIREGEVIARLESADYAAQVQRAKAQVFSVDAQIQRGEAAMQRADADLAEARRQLAWNEKLQAQEVASRDVVEASRSRVKLAEASLRQAQADIDQSRADRGRATAEVTLNEALFQNTVIRAPFTGVVVKKMAEVGESVAPIPPGVNISTASGAIVALADLDTLEVEVDVAESNVAKLTTDQPAEVSVEAFPDRKYKAALRQVIPTADRTKATVMVKVTILDKDKDLKPEMSARVTFIERPSAETSSQPSAAPRYVVTAPEDAVVVRDGSSIVFEIVDERARARKISTGGNANGRVIVKDGLVGSETLIEKPPEGLKDGDNVRVKS